MDPFESHSFIVKVWLEEDDEATWRGHITHVPSQERRYLQTVDDIARFIEPYLERLGVKPQGPPKRRLNRTRLRSER